MIKYLFTNNYEYERYQDTCQDRWDNGGSEELGEIDFTNAEQLMQYIMDGIQIHQSLENKQHISY